jgi:hypothetical protein
MFMLGVATLITVILIPAGQPLAFAGAAGGALNAAYPLQFTNAVVATHSTKGVVKSIDDNTLVITRSVRRGKEMTFELAPTTLREGSVRVGTVVEVRYRTKASRRVAAVVSAQDSKRQR